MHMSAVTPGNPNQRPSGNDFFMHGTFTRLSGERVWIMTTTEFPTRPWGWGEVSESDLLQFRENKLTQHTLHSYSGQWDLYTFRACRGKSCLPGAHDEVREVRHKYNADIAIIENQKKETFFGGDGETFMEEVVLLGIFWRIGTT